MKKKWLLSVVLAAILALTGVFAGVSAEEDFEPFCRIDRDDPNAWSGELENLRLLTKGCTPAYPLVDALTYSSDVTIDTDEGPLTVPYTEIALHTSIAMQDLTVVSASMNENKNSSSYGCLTLTCDCHGVPVTVYTTALYDANRTLITNADFIEKTLTVRGFVDVHDGAYQIKVTSLNGITVQE